MPLSLRQVSNPGLPFLQFGSDLAFVIFPVVMPSLWPEMAVTVIQAAPVVTGIPALESKRACIQTPTRIVPRPSRISAYLFYAEIFLENHATKRKTRAVSPLIFHIQKRAISLRRATLTRTICVSGIIEGLLTASQSTITAPGDPGFQ